MWLWRVEPCRCNQLQAKANEMKNNQLQAKANTPCWCTCWFNAIAPASFRHMFVINAVFLLLRAMQCKTDGTNDTIPCALPENADCTCLHKRTTLLLLKAALLPLLLAGQALWQQLAPADCRPDAENWRGCQTSGSR